MSKKRAKTLRQASIDPERYLSMRIDKNQIPDGAEVVITIRDKETGELREVPVNAAMETCFGKNSRFYRQVMSDGNIFNPYIHRRWLPAQFRRNVRYAGYSGITEFVRGSYWITKEYFLEYELERQALQHFYNRTQPEFAPKLNVESMTTEEYIHALNHPEEGAERLARAYVRSKAIFINRRLWELPLIAQRLKELESTPGEHHLRRRIAESIGEEKMVRLDLNKNGQQLSVRIEASELKRTEGSAYSTYRMDAPGRRAFVAAFGRREDLQASDIVRISYGKRVLYEKSPDADASRTAGESAK